MIRQGVFSEFLTVSDIPPFPFHKKKKTTTATTRKNTLSPGRLFQKVSQGRKTEVSLFTHYYRIGSEISLCMALLSLTLSGSPVTGEPGQFLGLLWTQWTSSGLFFDSFPTYYIFLTRTSLTVFNVEMQSVIILRMYQPVIPVFTFYYFVEFLSFGDWRCNASVLCWDI